ncbi:hypothetical protein C8A01DRAFT_34096 [Parachaetomium inaequale]|uniref:Uncharacterized protein n=1 Tax=Parachaetomium inaequale TaxID=2588326 RepID=A0AAN6PNP0_9PEZI|nr:hypothetical protein C8A01DRAFT_34096 [Parachaetomium inaequale]
MSRLYRPFRTLFGSAKIASRLSGGQTVRIERVKFKKRRSATRVLSTVIKSALVFQLLMWAIPPTPADTTKESEGRDGDKEAPTFIPLPLTTKKLPPQPYSKSDPEWQEFIRISNDRQLQHRIRHYIAEYVLEIATQHPVAIARIGKEVRLGRYWMGFEYPRMAPPVYERTGILITDDAVALVTRPHDPWIAKQLDRALNPRPLALGVWAFGTAMVKQTALDVAKYFGFASETPSSAPARPTLGPPPPLPSDPRAQVQNSLEQIRQQATRRPEEVDNRGSMSSSASAPSASPSKPIGVGKPAPDQNNQETSKQKPSAEDLVLSLAGSEPWKKLKQTYDRERRPFRADPPRGSIYVSGLVELETPKAWVVFDVTMWYDPKTKARAPFTTSLYLRRITPKYGLRPNELPPTL